MVFPETFNSLLPYQVAAIYALSGSSAQIISQRNYCMSKATFGQSGTCGSMFLVANFYHNMTT